MVIINEASLSKKLSVKLDKPSTISFIKKLIKEYEIPESAYTLTKTEFVLNNYKQYVFTDVRRDVYLKGLKYKEE